MKPGDRVRLVHGLPPNNSDAVLDEIDRPRLLNAWLRRIADDRGEENERLRGSLRESTVRS